MNKWKHMCFSRKRQQMVLLCLTLMTCTIAVYYYICSLHVLTYSHVQNLRKNGSSLPFFLPMCSIVRPNSIQNSAGSLESVPVASSVSVDIDVGCQAELNRTLCPTCLRPTVKDLVHKLQDKSNTVLINKTDDYFKIGPNIVEYLMTNYLLVPTITCSNIYLIIIQPSILDRLNERNVVRNTWGSVASEQKWPNRSINAMVKVIFVVAKQPVSDNISLIQMNEIRREAATHNDILFIDMIDSYQNLTLKLTSTFKWVKDNYPNVKFVLKVDYDTFVNVPLLVDLLLYHEKTFEFSIVGHVYTSGNSVHRKDKWAVPVSLYPLNVYPEYTSGCAYILSYKAMSKMVDIIPYVRMLPVEDAFITGIMRVFTGCQMFTFHSMFTHYLDKNWYYCWMLEDKKISGLTNSGILHSQIWDTFKKGHC